MNQDKFDEIDIIMSQLDENVVHGASTYDENVVLVQSEEFDNDTDIIISQLDENVLLAGSAADVDSNSVPEKSEK